MASDDVETVYLTSQDGLELYAAFAGGTAADAANLLRSSPALEGALARPQIYAHYQDADLALQAAVLAHGIATDPELADWIIGLSDRLTPEALAELLRLHLSRAQPT